ncbi:MAG: SusD/RagB family nutrient-binding outer membrane lipoprotein [Gemmatimonadota bacterium]
MNMNRGIAGRMASLMVLASMLPSCDFIQSTTVDPNAVPDATIDQLFAGIQVNTFYFSESQVGRLAAIWTQQMAGTDRQFATLDQYVLTEGDADGEFSSVYTGGGLVDLKRAVALAEDGGRRVYAGILKIHEAYLVGMAASVWGDIPFSQAADPGVATPALDDQSQVYASVGQMLDAAIADISSGEGTGPGGSDLNFGGDADAWLQIAYTLKARFLMHQAELGGAAMYQAALTAARLGIDDPNRNWRAIHSTAAPEQNLWFQFMRDRSGYISGGDYLIPLMTANQDPRLSLYFAQVDGAYQPRVSSLSETGFGARDFSFPFVTCAEARFIEAEASYRLGDEAGARGAALAGLACQESEWSVDLSGIATTLQAAGGPELFDRIMEQKYTALFLNAEVWNDYKRTCRPGFVPRAGGVPGRLFYGLTERQTNPNIPAPAQQPQRNANDPNPCT